MLRRRDAPWGLAVMMQVMTHPLSFTGVAGAEQQAVLPMGACAPQFREGHCYVIAYLSVDGPIRPPVGSWLNHSGQPISQRVVEPEGPRRTQKRARHKKSHTEPGPRAPSPFHIPRGCDRQIQDFLRFASRGIRNFAK